MRFAGRFGPVLSAALLAGCPTPPPGAANSGGTTPRDLRTPPVDQTAPPASDGAAPGGGAPQTCADVKAALDALVQAPARKSCASDKDCQVLAGACGQGLGGCHYALNLSVSQEAISTLGERYERLGCTSAVCRCAAPKPVTCQRGACGFAQ